LTQKNVKIGDFTTNNRKTSPYLPQKWIHFLFNGKASPYFTLQVTESVVDKIFD
jgi:hypothetical protein